MMQNFTFCDDSIKNKKDIFKNSAHTYVNNFSYFILRYDFE
jgi:hypothetical protein